MDKSIKFSIIMPVYNVEEYIAQAIESIINQSYKNWELIIINDGSIDKSGIICNDYENIDSRIKVYHQENHGVSFSRNRALKLISGDYIGFVDSDDWVEKDWLETISKYIDENKDTDLFVSSWIEEYENLYKKIELDDIKMNNDEFKKYYTCKYTKNKFPGFCCNKIYKKSIIQNLEFDESLDIIEDEVFNYSVYMNLNNILIINKAIYHYRKVDRESLTTIAKYKYQDMMFNRAKKINLIKRNLYYKWKINDDKFIEFIEKQYIYSMYDCILNICVYCDDNRKIKVKIGEITNDKRLIDNLKVYKDNNKIYLIMELVIKLKNYIFIYILINFIYKLSKLKRNLNSKYKGDKING